MVQALTRLVSPRVLFNPTKTVTEFVADFKMVLNCHRERTFLLNQQPHLTNWLPIAVPLDRWLLWPAPVSGRLPRTQPPPPTKTGAGTPIPHSPHPPPPPCQFGYYPAALGSFGLFWIFFKFYDSLSGWNVPPSHIMSKARTLRKFPQLVDRIKYCVVFYEGQHNDARTNVALALTAAAHGATVANHAAMTQLITDDRGKAVGVRVRDLTSRPGGVYGGAEGVGTGGGVGGAAGRGSEVKSTDASSMDDGPVDEFEVRGKSVVFCGGPFTDDLRRLEAGEEAAEVKPVVTGASGIHVVNIRIPACTAARPHARSHSATAMRCRCSRTTTPRRTWVWSTWPPGERAAEARVSTQCARPPPLPQPPLHPTSDGRFLFFLPWLGHTIVGTTDSKCDKPTMVSKSVRLGTMQP